MDGRPPESAKVRKYEQAAVSVRVVASEDVDDTDSENVDDTDN